MMKIIKRVINLALSAAISTGCIGAVYRNYGNDYSIICLAADDYLGIELETDGNITISMYTGTAETVVIPESYNGRKITAIGSYAFSKNPSIKEVVFSENIKKIERGAFAACPNLESVKFPDSLEIVDDFAFDSCEKLSTLDLNNVKEMGYCAFQLCTSLTSIFVPGSLTTLGDHSFQNCEKASSLIIGEGVKTIEEMAAVNLYNLKSITIPKSVTSIADNSLGFYYRSANYTKSEDVELLVYSNSAGLEYAKKFGFKYQVVDSFLTNPYITAPKPVLPPIRTSVTTASPVYVIGDLNNDEIIDSSDASVVLTEYSAIQTGKGSLLTNSQKKSADVSGDGVVDASDASEILQYYARISTGKTVGWK